MLEAGFSVRWSIIFLESIIITPSSLSSLKLFIYQHNQTCTDKHTQACNMCFFSNIMYFPFSIILSILYSSSFLFPLHDSSPSSDKAHCLLHRIYILILPSRVLPFYLDLLSRFLQLLHIIYLHLNIQNQHPQTRNNMLVLMILVLGYLLQQMAILLK